MKRLFILFVTIFIASGLEPLRCFSQGKRTHSVVISTWNIGHFANGKNNHSQIKGRDYHAKLKKLNAVIEDSIGADVLCINEYSAVLGVDPNQKERETKKVLLSKYTYKKEGRLMGFSCNSIFSNLLLKNVKECLFNSSLPFLKDVPRAANYYYLCADLYLNGEKVKLICAHTTSGAVKISRAQINELIQKYKGYDKVIMCGDWNIANFSQFTKAGYTMINDGSIVTFPSKSYAFDNILVKGLKISDVRVIKTDLSDHYPLVCKISLN